jgi:hypothetical protein
MRLAPQQVVLAEQRWLQQMELKLALLWRPQGLRLR